MPDGTVCAPRKLVRIDTARSLRDPSLASLTFEVGSIYEPRFAPESFDAAFQRRDALLQDCIGRIADAGVDVANHLIVEQGRAMLGAVKFEGDGLVDRYSYGFGSGITVVAGVNC